MSLLVIPAQAGIQKVNKQVSFTFGKIDNGSLMRYQRSKLHFQGAEDEGNITVNIKRHRIGIMPVGGVFVCEWS